MNKIVLNDENIVDVICDDSVSYEIIDDDSLDIKVLNIKVLKSCDISFYYRFSDFKVEVCIEILPFVSVNIYERVSGDCVKIRTKYSLSQGSNVSVSKFSDINSIKEYIITNLNGENASITYNLKTIAIGVQNYDVLTYHNAKNTNSDINLNGVNVDGNISFNVSSFIPNGNSKSVASQNNKIINLTDNECIIKPNLYIDECDIVANHSAWIGSFNPNELFYLQSRGIKKDEAMKLLIKGFLTTGLRIDDDQKEELLEKINSYWR